MSRHSISEALRTSFTNHGLLGVVVFPLALLRVVFFN